MKNFLRPLFALCLGLVAITAWSLTGRATVVIPPTFDELVTRADAVFTGEVTGVSSQYTGEGANRHIVSYATFNVLRVMKGQAASPYTLRMLGGTVGTRTMVVEGAPKFATGERAVIFVKDNGRQFFPAVGVMHGVYRLQHAPGAGAAASEAVYDHAGRALESVADIGLDEPARRSRHLAARPAGATAAEAPLTREQFENAIAERVGAPGFE